MLRSMLKYKCEHAGIRYAKVHERNTTRACSCCGAIPASSPRGRTGLRIREWNCSECGARHDRDVNAARNILELGHQLPAEGIPVRRGTAVGVDAIGAGPTTGTDDAPRQLLGRGGCQAFTAVRVRCPLVASLSLRMSTFWLAACFVFEEEEEEEVIQWSGWDKLPVWSTHGASVTTHSPPPARVAATAASLDTGEHVRMLR